MVQKILLRIKKFGFIYLLCFQDDNTIGGILDFSIAALSSCVLLFSVLNDKWSDKAKYIFMDSLYILLTSVGFVIVLILGMRLENPSTMGRTLLFICFTYFRDKESVGS